MSSANPRAVAHPAQAGCSLPRRRRSSALQNGRRCAVYLFCLVLPLLPTSASAADEAKKWHDIPVSKPDNRITIHYHRADKSYVGVNLWTWDGEGKKTPKQNWIDPIGEDNFGAVFQIDRASYGESNKIGLIPRVGTDWSQKDGSDKFWTPPLGHEIWLVSRKDKVFAKRPDLSPHLEGAYLDAPDRVVLVLSDPATAPPAVSILNEKDESVAATLTVDDSTALELTVTPADPLDITQHQYRVQVEGFGPPVPLTPRAILDDRDLFFDADVKLGASCTEEATTFRIFAPTAKAVSLALYDNATGEKGGHVEALARESKGLWSVTVKGDLRGKFYSYLLEGPGLNPEHEVLDPYATNSVASSTRGRLAPLPASATGGPKVESSTDLVIYEMHVRDFTIDPNSGVENRGLYLGWTEGGTHLPSDPALKTALDHLSELGVTHVQLMPVQDFENDETKRGYNWGYITSDFFSPEGLFATRPNDESRVREFKALVDALHARGIGVIMDVVYNHTSGSAPFFAIAPEYYYRHLPDGSLAAGSGVGNEFRSEAPMVRKLIIDSLKYWVTEYGIDGFRFDLMALIDQETMHEADRALREINPDIVLFGEPWTGGDSPLVEKTDKDAMRQMEPIGAFNDDFRNALKGSPDGNDPGWIENGSHADALKDAMRVTAWFASPAQSINYMTCHDNLVLWDKLKAAMPEANEATLEATAKLGYLALLTAQGVPFFQGGEEFARSKGGNNNSYDSPDAVNQVDWSLKKKHLAMFRYVRDLIALRKAHPLFRLRTREEVEARVKFADTPDDKLLVFTIDGDGVPGETWKSACVILNSDGNAAEVTLPEGRWTVAFDEHGATRFTPASSPVRLPRKSGVVLFQARNN